MSRVILGPVTISLTCESEGRGKSSASTIPQHGLHGPDGVRSPLFGPCFRITHRRFDLRPIEIRVILQHLVYAHPANDKCRDPVSLNVRTPNVSHIVNDTRQIL